MADKHYYEHLMELLETNEELKKTSKGIFKQMAWAAGSAAVGGVVGGPPGALVGGIAGASNQMTTSQWWKCLKTYLMLIERNWCKKVQELVGSSSIEALDKFISNEGQRRKELLIGLLQDYAKAHVL